MEKLENLQNSLPFNLDEAAEEYAPDFSDSIASKAAVDAIRDAFKAGVELALNNLWKPANGGDLPEIDREVIVLYQPYPLENSEYAVSFAHRPKEYWDGKSIATGEITRYYPKRYDKGNWNIPNVKWWLDLNLPKTEE